MHWSTKSFVQLSTMLKANNCLGTAILQSTCTRQIRNAGKQRWYVSVTYTRIYLERNVAPVCQSIPEYSLHLAGLVCWPWLAQHSPSVHLQLGIVATRHGILVSCHDHCCLQRRSTHLCSESSAATKVSVFACVCVVSLRAFFATLKMFLTRQSSSGTEHFKQTTWR